MVNTIALAKATVTGKDLYTLSAPMQHHCPRCSAQPGEKCVSKTGAIAPILHAGRSKQLCNEHFIKQVHHDDRLNCAKLAEHRGKHRNAANDLTWHQDFQVDLDD